MPSPEHNLNQQWQNWQEQHKFKPEYLELARQVLEEVRHGSKFSDSVRRHPLPEGGHLAKYMLVSAYRLLVENGVLKEDPLLLSRIRMKPVRTLSGVTTVTVLTESYPCPGKCIFCPTDIRMPKSYLRDEPGARRALQHQFDPYTQVASRLESLESLGHPTDKVELLILGGTWSAYPKKYQVWFVRRCFEALNGMNGASRPEAALSEQIDLLTKVQQTNESAQHRNVGLVVETRPDHVNVKELARLRRLGVTKVQLGAQSLDDTILSQNCRGHNVADTRQAMALLRAAGFKIVLHWMPNLLGATIDSDRHDFQRLWDGFCPDEIKIYPNQLLENTELYTYWQRGEFKPYTTDELVQLVADIKPTIPRYCRVNRVVRDIPSTNVVEGNKRSSLRQDVQQELHRRGTRCQCIRCREVRGQKVESDNFQMHDLIYQAGGCEEHFLSFDTPNDHLVGFLRLSLPGADTPKTGFSDLEKAAIIREVHVFGQSIPVGTDERNAVQHIGLGTRLLLQAEELARQAGFPNLAVISAVGTRHYYLERGFNRGEFYQVKKVS
jgi:elongator complex protein 3